MSGAGWTPGGVRIHDSLVADVISNEGTADGVTPVSPTGIVRLALDLQDARATNARLVKALEAWGELDEHQSRPFHSDAEWAMRAVEIEGLRATARDLHASALCLARGGGGGE